MPGIGGRLRLRLFVEGVEVPVIAATVQAVPNAPVSCSIQIPPLAEGTRFLPRSTIHLFFLDFYEQATPFPTKAGANNTGNNQSPTDYQNTIEADPSNAVQQTQQVGDDPDLNNASYKLLFGGEMIGFQWTKNQAQRSLVLQCLDWSNYWDYAYQWNNTDLFGPGVKAIFSGGSTNLFTDFLEDEGSAIIRIIQTPSVQYPKLKGLLGGIVHLLEAIGGSYYYGGKQFAGENIFFSIAELRLHITQLITAYESDPTASRLLTAGYDSLFGRMLGGLGQQVSIRQAINALMSVIFHETYGQPCPRFVPATGNSPTGQTRASVRKNPNFSFIATVADSLQQGIADLLQFLQTPPSGSASTEVLLGSLQDMRNTCASTVARITDKSVLPAKSFYSSALRSFDQARAKARKWVPGANAGIISSVSAPLNDALLQLQRASNFEVVTTQNGTTPARLNQQIFRPDVWFSAPPRCNVIFPELYHTVQYQRQFLMEPTRLLLKTNDTFFGEDELFDQFYFAPKGFTLKTGGRELQDILANDLLDHELFTGILPVFEKMGELNIFAARSGTVNGQVPKIGLAQRSCNFLYFKYRFAARQLSLQGRFNPYLAAGFPALVIDKWSNADTLALREQLIAQNNNTSTPDIDKLLGMHVLCNLTEVTHSVTQNSGNTELNCSYARDPNESVEFLGVLRPGQAVQKRAQQDATRITVVAALSSPLINSQGPNGGSIVGVQDVTQAYRAQSPTSGNPLPLYQGPPRAGTTQARISVLIGLSLPASSYGQDVVTLIGNPSELVRFRAFRVTEDVPRYSKQTEDLPAEEYIRPGWYGDIWHPNLIGQAYQQFFGTGAITDQQQVDAVGNASLGVSYETAAQALQQAAKAIDADDPLAAEPGLLALVQGSSVAGAVAFIVATYSLVKQQSLDVENFIRTYTWRPIATLVDMFGSSDLTLDPSGQSVIQGVEGFHSRAFGDHDDLFGLVTGDIENIVGIKRGSTAAQRGDTRLRKRQAVQLYVAQLQYARAVLG